MNEFLGNAERYNQASEKLDRFNKRFNRVRAVNVAFICTAMLGGASIAAGPLTGYNILNDVVEVGGMGALVCGIGGFALTGIEIQSMVSEEERLVSEKRRYNPNSNEL